jgi:uncharacterized protein
MHALLPTFPLEIDPDVACSACDAVCCRLEVMLLGDNEVPEHLTSEDEWGGWTMRRLDDGWCAALNRNDMRCTIYEHRPFICRDYQMGDSDCVEERRRYASTAANTLP